MTKIVKKANRNFVNKNLIIRYNRVNKKNIYVEIHGTLDSRLIKLVAESSETAPEEIGGEILSELNNQIDWICQLGIVIVYSI